MWHKHVHKYPLLCLTLLIALTYYTSMHPVRRFFSRCLARVNSVLSNYYTFTGGFSTYLKRTRRRYPGVRYEIVKKVNSLTGFSSEKFFPVPDTLQWFHVVDIHHSV